MDTYRVNSRYFVPGWRAGQDGRTKRVNPEIRFSHLQQLTSKKKSGQQNVPVGRPAFKYLKTKSTRRIYGVDLK